MYIFLDFLSQLQKKINFLIYSDFLQYKVNDKMNEELKEPKKSFIKKLIDFFINFLPFKSKKEKKESSKTDDIYPMW
jgi:hypothetical protein